MSEGPQMVVLDPRQLLGGMVAPTPPAPVPLTDAVALAAMRRHIRETIDGWRDEETVKAMTDAIEGTDDASPLETAVLAHYETEPHWPSFIAGMEMTMRMLSDALPNPCEFTPKSQWFRNYVAVARLQDIAMSHIASAATPRRDAGYV